MNTQTIQTEVTTRRSEAHGAYCPTCDAILGCQYWHWSKSKAMHEKGTGHTVQMYRIVVA